MMVEMRSEMASVLEILRRGEMRHLVMFNQGIPWYQNKADTDYTLWIWRETASTIISDYLALEYSGNVPKLISPPNIT